ncbi:MAG TPA: DUF177 domain-containing protein [Chryseosolibacter sp.]|nr:DUF177 domain-containing protein [Chryseosolibacter sp.]
MGASAFRVNIVGLANKVHHFDFEMGNDFFEKFGTELLTEGSLKADVALDKRETLIDATFVIDGSVKLVCDRSLDTFDQPIHTKKKLVFKYGETDEELSDEIVVIRRDTDSLELGHYIFEFIALEVPMKKLHPRFRDEEAEDDDSEGKIIYTSKPSPDDDRTDGEDIDPRWDVLKKLK